MCLRLLCIIVLPFYLWKEIELILYFLYYWLQIKFGIVKEKLISDHRFSGIRKNQTKWFKPWTKMIKEFACYNYLKAQRTYLMVTSPNHLLCHGRQQKIRLGQIIFYWTNFISFPNCITIFSSQFPFSKMSKSYPLKTPCMWQGAHSKRDTLFCFFLDR